MNDLRFVLQLLEAGQSGGAGGVGGGGGGGAHADTGAHLGGVQVVIDQAVDDLGEVVLDDGVTDLLQGGVKRKQGAEPLNELDDVIHGGVAGDPLVNVGDNVHTDVTQEVLGLLDLAGLGGGGDDQEREGD